MEELIDLMVSDESPSKVSDAIKDVLYAKTAERIETVKPNVASSVFDYPESEEGAE
jgi:hypothetical protein